MAEVSGPPILRIGHDCSEIFFDCGKIEALEFFGIVEVPAHGIGLGRVLVQKIDLEMIGPPVANGPRIAGGVVNRAFSFS
jgi:hypothetical protein